MNIKSLVLGLVLMGGSLAAFAQQAVTLFAPIASQEAWVQFEARLREFKLVNADNQVDIARMLPALHLDMAESNPAALQALPKDMHEPAGFVANMGRFGLQPKMSLAALKDGVLNQQFKFVVASAAVASEPKPAPVAPATVAAAAAPKAVEPPVATPPPVDQAKVLKELADRFDKRFVAQQTEQEKVEKKTERLRLAAAIAATKAAVAAAKAEVEKFLPPLLAAEAAASAATAANKAEIAVVKAGLEKLAPQVLAVEKAASAAQVGLTALTNRVTDAEGAITNFVVKDWFWGLALLVGLLTLLTVFLLGRFGGFKREIDRQMELVTNVSSTANTANRTALSAWETARTAEASAKSAGDTAGKAVVQAGEAMTAATAALHRPTVVEWSSGNSVSFNKKTAALADGECHTEKVGLSDGRSAELKICGAGPDNLVVNGIAGTKTCLRTNVAKVVYGAVKPLKDGHGEVVADTRFERFVEA